MKRRLDLVVLLLAVIGACKTAPPPAPAQPVEVPVQAAPEAKPAPPQVFVRVTASKLNVRKAPSLDAPIVTSAKKGDELLVVGQGADWFQVKVADEMIGWVHSRYVKRGEPCLPDKATAEILNPPPLTFAGDASRGRVVLEASVNASGAVVATRRVESTTSDETLVRHAEEELKQLKFSPPMRRCRPVPFVYTYTRNF